VLSAIFALRSKDFRAAPWRRVTAEGRLLSQRSLPWQCLNFVDHLLLLFPLFTSQALPDLTSGSWLLGTEFRIANQEQQGMNFVQAMVLLIDFQNHSRNPFFFKTRIFSVSKIAFNIINELNCF